MEVYYSNLKVMFELFADSGLVEWRKVLSAIFATMLITLFSVAQIQWILVLYLVLGFIIFIGTKSVLTNLCDPYTIKSFIDTRKLTDFDIKASYSYLKRSRWFATFQTLIFFVQAAAIIFLGGMLYTGLAWLVLGVLYENLYHKNNQKMKMLWAKYKSQTT